MKKMWVLSMLMMIMCFLFAHLVAPSLLFASYFMGLGDLPGGITHSEAFGVSDDGSVVVGYSGAEVTTEAFRWDAANGMVSLSDLPGGTTSSSALGISADGSVVVGHYKTPMEAFRWDAVNGMVGLGGLLDNVISVARGVSANGNIVVGNSYSYSSQESRYGFEAFRWDDVDGMVGLGDLPGGAFRSDAYAASADGSVVVGFSDSAPEISQQRWEAFRWTGATGMVGLGFLPNWPSQSIATAVSADGSVVVGYGGSGREAFRWTNETGMVSLGQLPGGSTYSEAWGVSADGSVVVGGATTVTISRVPFRWDDTNGMQNIVDLLENEGIDLTGWYLQNATAVSADGTTIVGTGINPAGDTEAWIAYISPANSSPIANAGNDETVHPGTPVTLDGSASFDPDENYPLSYAWEIVSKPPGSMATLSGSDSVNPSFTPDLLGDYTVELIVTDSLNASSAADQVLISTYNTPPVADAGPDQAVVELGTTVQLDGCQSYDLDGDNITFSWTFTSKPAGSNSTLNDSTLCNPAFTADIQGTYLMSLVVFDVFGASSGIDEVAISFENVRPIAVAGVNQSVATGDTVYLNGLGSTDANLDPLSFNWSFISKPSGSTAELGNPTSPQTSFLADLAGYYIISLIVNDGYLDSEPSNIEVRATASQDAATESLQEAIYEINNIIPDHFKNLRMKNALTNKINSVLEMIDGGLFQEALDKLQNDIIKKTNGCFETGVVDRNDWILNCDEQNQIYSIIMEAIDHLTTLI